MTKEFDLNNNQSKNNAFSGDALNISDLAPAEQEVYNMMPEILAFMNGLSGVIASVKIAEELYADEKKKHYIRFMGCQNTHHLDSVVAALFHRKLCP